MTEEKVLTGYPSIDKPWLKYYSEEAKASTVPEMTACEYLYECNKDGLNANALDYFGTKITFKEFFKRIEQCAKCFEATGVKKGDIVTICMPSTVETIVAIYALNKIGAIPDMLDPRSNKNQLQFYLTENESKLLLLYDACYPKIKDFITETNVKKVVLMSVTQSLPYLSKVIYSAMNKKTKRETPEGSLYTAWAEFIKSSNSKSDNSKAESDEAKLQETKSPETESANTESADKEPSAYEKNKPAIMVHSSGTSGTPKGIILTNENLNAVAVQFRVAPLHAKPGDKFLSAIPAFAAFGMVASIHMPLTYGMCAIIQPMVTADNIVKLVIKYKPNHCLTVPRNYDVLTNDKRVKDLSFFHSLGCGGDAVNSNVEKRIEEDLKNKNSVGALLKGWGMSELASAACMEMPERKEIGSVGIPLVQTTIGIFEPGTDKELPYNTQGEICVIGPNVMFGYFKNEPLNQKVLKTHSDGRVWLHSGDIAHMTEEGMITIDGRVERMIIRFDGFKIYPPAIEDVIVAHTDIDNCAVIGVKDDVNGKVPKAFIVASPECTKDRGALKEEVIELCKSKLAERAVPYYFEFLDELPMTLMGKVDYRALEDREETIE